MSIIEVFYRALTRGFIFAVVVIVLFNMLTDVATKTGFVIGALTTSESQYFGIVSVFLALFDALTNRLFGLVVIR